MKYGWIPSLPDFRDMATDHPEVTNLLTGVMSQGRPPLFSLRDWIPATAIRDQKDLGSCTAQSVSGLVEYYGRRTQKDSMKVSALYLYKATRSILGLVGDTGADIRSTIKALRIFGVPPEQYWPYNVDKFEVEPNWIARGFATEFQAIKYTRLDTNGTAPSRVLDLVRSYIRNGFPVAFGFSCFSSIDNVGSDGVVPFPSAGERLEGGHAVYAAAYDDNRRLLGFPNSWTTGWGDGGWGWLPYDYILKGLAEDFWVLLSQEWVNLKDFD